MILTKGEKEYIKKITQKLSKISLIVIRRSSTGNLTGSKPCSACIKIMKLLKMKKVYYSNSNGEMVLEKINMISSDHKSQMLRHMDTNRIY